MGHPPVPISPAHSLIVGMPQQGTWSQAQRKVVSSPGRVELGRVYVNERRKARVQISGKGRSGFLGAGAEGRVRVPFRSRSHVIGFGSERDQRRGFESQLSWRLKVGVPPGLGEGASPHHLLPVPTAAPPAGAPAGSRRRTCAAPWRPTCCSSGMPCSVECRSRRPRTGSWRTPSWLGAGSWRSCSCRPGPGSRPGR